MKVKINHTASADSKVPQTPGSTLRKIRHLITDGEHSATKIAAVLNGFDPETDLEDGPKFRRATGLEGNWSSADIFSVLGRQDMEGLRETLFANKPPEPEPEAELVEGGLSPLAFRQTLSDDLKALLTAQTRDLTDRLQSAGGTDLGGVAAKLTELSESLATQPNAPSLADIKTTLSDVLSTKLRDQPSNILDRVVADTADEVCAVFEKVIARSDLPAVKRMSERAAENVGTIAKKLDDTTDALFDSLKAGMGLLDSAISDQCGEISTIIVDHIDQQFMALLSSIDTRVQATIDKHIGNIVKASIKEALSTIQNSHAVQAQHFEKTVEKMIDRLITGKLDKLGERLVILEEAEKEWVDDDTKEWTDDDTV